MRVEALYDRDEAERATLTNLLQRRGYQDLDAVLAEGREEGFRAGETQGEARGRASALLTVLEARGVRIGKAARERIERSTDLAELDHWLRRAAVVRKVSELFE